MGTRDVIHGHKMTKVEVEGTVSAEIRSFLNVTLVSFYFRIHKRDLPIEHSF